MKKNRTAAPADSRLCVVVDLDDEIVEMVVAREPVAIAVAGDFQRPVVVAA